ncbi:MAG TPA: TetR/AcrR family transcriptional regulator [Herpetosiphonaceae bacterium]
MDNRGRLLESALQLFASRGYDAIGVQEVCDTAGVTKPTLYHYFGNKRGLLEALVQERGGPLLAELREAAAYKGDLPRSLQGIVATYFQFFAREPALYRLLLTSWLAIPENEAFQVVVAFNDEQHRLVETLFAAAIVDHGNMRGRQRTYAATFLGMINTYISLALQQYVTLDETVQRQAIQQFSYGIYS